MRRFPFFLVLFLLPLALFAQARQGPEKKMLQQLGLADAQVSQVLDIQSRTRDAMVQQRAQVRLLQAQIDKAMVATTVDMQAVNGLVDQLSQARAAAQKSMLGARVQLQQIMGPDNFREYMRHVRQQFARGFGHGFGRGFERGPGSRGMPMMRGGGAWM